MRRPWDGHAVIGFLDFRSLCGPSVPAPLMQQLLRTSGGQKLLYFCSATLLFHDLYQPALLHGGVDEAGKQRVRLEGARLQLGMILHPDEPGVVWELHGFRQQAVR